MQTAESKVGVGTGFPDDEVVDIKRILLGIWRGRYIILATVALAQAAAIYLAFKKPLRYTSQSDFIFKDGSPASSFSSLASVIGLPAPSQGGADISSYYERVIFSNEFLGKLADKSYVRAGDTIALEDLWNLKFSREGENWRYRRYLSLTGRLRGAKHILLAKDKATGVILLKTSFEDPGVALQINNSILDLLNEYVLLNVKSQARENRKFIEARLKEVESDLSTSENKILAFSEKNRDPSSPYLMLQYTRLKRDVAINQELFTELKKKFELAKIDEMKENPLLDVIARPNLALEAEPRGVVKMLALFSALGLVCGIFLALSHAWLKAHFPGSRVR